MHERISVPLADRSYDIVIAPGLLGQAAQAIAPKLKSARVIVVTDENVGPVYAPALSAELVSHGIRVDTVTLPAGESTKSFTVFASLMDRLLSLQPDRRTTLVALGGGVIGDITGFAASVLLRGVDFIQLPTTLLAQVDSSVGGKTGINTAQGKNLVGSFYQPQLVLIDTETLATLPARERQAGYAEIMKYGLIGDAGFYDWLLANGRALLAGDAALVSHAIAQSCRMKAAIVGADERESAARALLNFGHTFGHALEAEMGYGGALLHGEAVAVGMVMACRLSEALSGLSPEVGDGLVAHLREVGMRTHPTEIRAAWDVDRLMMHMAGDKKAEDGKLTFILLDALGKARVQKDVPAEVARRVVQAFV